MVVDEDEGPSSLENNNSELLQLIYEKLVAFVSDKPNFKLRYFDAVEAEQERQEEEDREVVSGRKITCAYIQIKMEIKDVSEPLEIILKISENSNVVLTVEHEILPENGLSRWMIS